MDEDDVDDSRIDVRCSDPCHVRMMGHTFDFTVDRNEGSSVGDMTTPTPSPKPGDMTTPSPSPVSEDMANTRSTPEPVDKANATSTPGPGDVITASNDR